MDILCPECGKPIKEHADNLKDGLYEAHIAAMQEKLEAAAKQWTLNAYAPNKRMPFRKMKKAIRDIWPTLAETLDALALADAVLDTAATKKG